MNYLKRNTIYVFFRLFSFTFSILLMIFYVIKYNNGITHKAMLLILIIFSLLYLTSFFIIHKNNNFKKAITKSTIYLLITSSLLYFFGFKILSIFPFESGITNFTVFALRILLVSTPIIGFKIYSEIYYCKYFSSIESTPSKLILLTLSFKNLIIFLIFSYILSNILGFTGVLWSIVIMNILSTLINFFIKKFLLK